MVYRRFIKVYVLLRPIVSTISSPCYLLANELARILSPLASRTDTFVKNSTHFVQRISDLTIDDDDIMVSNSCYYIDCLLKSQLLVDCEESTARGQRIG